MWMKAWQRGKKKTTRKARVEEDDKESELHASMQTAGGWFAIVSH